MAVDELPHHQLRHFISQPERNIIYYANNQDIFELNVCARTRKHIATLPFQVRCTASGYGWICVGGGDEGNWARIQLNPPSASEVDSLLPLNLEYRQNGRRTRPTLPPPLPRVTSDQLGDDIVNSISIHQIQDDPAEPTEVLAVLTNNDRTVRIFSLTRDAELNRLELPFPANHATISPDGQMLVAVGDYQQAYFYERMDVPTSSSKAPISRPKKYEWGILNIVQLHVPSPTTIIGYFTTAWSPTGTLVAVGSECGYVSIFDVDILKKSDLAENALIDVFSGSRPDLDIGPGSIRSMVFAPQPWDLLVWAEDRGRVCVLDLRSGLRARQVVHLASDAPLMRRMEIADVHSRPATERPVSWAEEAANIRREHQRRNRDPTFAEGINQYAERIHAVLGNREREDFSREEADRDWDNAEPDTAEDLAIAMAHRALQRASIEAPELRNDSQYDPTTSQPNEFPWEGYSTYDLQRARDLARLHGHNISLTVPAQEPNRTRRLNNGAEWNALLIPWLHQIRTLDNDRPQDRLGDDDDSTRRMRLALAAFRARAGLDDDDHPSDPTTSTAAPSSSGTTTLTPTSDATRSQDHAWRLIENAALRPTYDLPTTTLGSDGRLIGITTSAAPPNLFVPRISGHMRQGTGGAAAGLRTAGLAWSVDYEELWRGGTGGREGEDPGNGDEGDRERGHGLRLWVGTEQGIFEMNVNLGGRRCWNSLMPI
ncbi:hypothetical protein P152DRAFT_452872 [Eremomyces bilateralis CBS 781.70]|uniref:DUF2415 domain-containing protein n=1 Tax=Eremomyces bilateralis CBS 781.70 TaxID=1392243 RepID=A0A6G1FRS0_9PEZI|nr:uncharacterized protein P152DRAFT_452872 [Eremomyces bilateralis CBS 781.70]KAF1808410.1 hypothetical protein P152DRAFT_452872 [Eremomyces bilateralis CBS 781.70]